MPKIALFTFLSYKCSSWIQTGLLVPDGVNVKDIEELVNRKARTEDFCPFVDGYINPITSYPATLGPEFPLHLLVKDYTPIYIF